MAITVNNQPIILNVTAIVGDTLDSWTITFSDSSGDPVDISGYDFYYIIKKSFGTLDSGAIISKGPADATKTDSGTGTTDTLQFVLSASDTEVTPGKYVHAIKFTNGAIERTWVQGEIEFTQRRIDTV